MASASPGYASVHIPGDFTAFHYGVEARFGHTRQWMTWRSYIGLHEYETILTFDSRQAARDDVARRVRFYRRMMRGGAK